MPLLKGRPSSSPLAGSTRSKALVMFAAASSTGLSCCRTVMAPGSETATTSELAL